MKSNTKLYGMTPEQVDKMAELSRDTIKGYRGFSMIMGPVKAGEPLLGGTTLIYHVADAQRDMRTHEKSMAMLNELGKGNPKSIFAGMEVKKIEVAGKPAFQVETSVPKPPEGRVPPGYDKIMASIFGAGGKMTAYIAAADEHTIVAAYVSKENLIKGLEAAKRPSDGLAKDADIAKTAALLPAGAQWLAYISPHGVVALVGPMAKEVGPQGGPALPEFARTPPIGLAVKAAKDELDVSLVVPNAIVKGGGEYAVKVQQAIADAAKAGKE
jgi:hypothetical protein